MKILSKILYGLFITSLALVAGLLLVSLLPITGNVEIKIVKSGSMEPTIHVGSIIVMRSSFAKATEDKPTYKVGDIIVFGEDTGSKIPTTHRIVAVEGQGSGALFTTKGDANEEADPEPTVRGDILGKVLFTVPALGYVLDFARKPVGFALLIGLPALMIIVDELITIVVEVGKLRRKKKGRGFAYTIPIPQKPRVRIPTI